jgi:hypothetical protein
VGCDGRDFVWAIDAQDSSGMNWEFCVDFDMCVVFCVCDLPGYDV